MAAIRSAVAWTLSRHDPYPAMALDRHWTLLQANRAARQLLGPIGLSEGSSLLDALLARNGLRQAIENWTDVAAQ